MSPDDVDRRRQQMSEELHAVMTRHQSLTETLLEMKATIARAQTMVREQTDTLKQLGKRL